MIRCKTVTRQIGKLFLSSSFWKENVKVDTFWEKYAKNILIGGTDKFASALDLYCGYVLWQWRSTTWHAEIKRSLFFFKKPEVKIQEGTRVMWKTFSFVYFPPKWLDLEANQSTTTMLSAFQSHMICGFQIVFICVVWYHKGCPGQCPRVPDM